MRIRGLLVNLCFNIVLPLLAVNILEARGVPVISALAISALFPVLETGGTWIRRRRLDAIGAISLTFIALGVGTSLLSGDVHFALAKGSFLTGAFGLVCLGTLLAPKPLMFYIGRSFATTGDPAAEQTWHGRWALPGFRSVLRTMTVVWGLTYLAEASLRFVFVYVLPVNVVIAISPIFGLLVSAVLITWTIRYGKVAERRGIARQAAKTAEPA